MDFKMIATLVSIFILMPLSGWFLGKGYFPSGVILWLGQIMLILSTLGVLK